MISFASLFVGLVFGIIPVELLVTERVERVELLLDGRIVAELREPWRVELDVGCTPSPRELSAVAYDGRGRELGRARQWINRPRPAADASLVVEPKEEGRPRVARLGFSSLVSEVPESVVVTLDDRELVVADPARIELPPVDEARLHTLRARVDFGHGVVAEAETQLGGGRRDAASRELTAVAVEVGRGRRLSPSEAFAGWLERDGVPLEVVAVEEGPMDVVFVCEGSARQALRTTALLGRWPARMGLPEDLRLRLLWPISSFAPQSKLVASTYPITSRFTAPDGRVVGRMVERYSWPVVAPEGQRLSDAVAVAALAVAEEERRRAVVLVLGPAARDGSLLSPEEALSLLSDLGVPLFVWSVGRTESPEAARWPEVTRVGNPAGIRSALLSLVERLARQRIVWVEGSHPPQAIEPAAMAKRVRRAGPVVPTRDE